jgi:hypothetical protein
LFRNSVGSGISDACPSLSCPRLFEPFMRKLPSSVSQMANPKPQVNLEIFLPGS